MVVVRVAEEKGTRVAFFRVLESVGSLRDPFNRSFGSSGRSIQSPDATASQKRMNCRIKGGKETIDNCNPSIDDWQKCRRTNRLVGTGIKKDLLWGFKVFLASGRAGCVRRLAGARNGSPRASLRDSFSPVIRLEASGGTDGGGFRGTFFPILLLAASFRTP